VPAAGPVPPPSMVVTPLIDLLRANEMDVTVDAAGGDDHAFPGDHLGGRADWNGDGRLYVGIAGLADGPDAAVLETDIGLHDTPVIDDHRIGDDGVSDVLVVALALPHAVADHLAATELDFLAVGGEIALDLDPQVGVGQSHAVAGGGAEHFGISLTRNFHGLSAPITRPLKPKTLRAPASATSSIVRSCPGSKRTAVPAAILRRMP